MGPTYFLATLEPVGPEELRAFIAELGGELDYSLQYDGTFFGRRGRLDVRWATKERLESILAADQFVDTPLGVRERQTKYEKLLSVAEALGGPPHDFIQLDLLSRSPSQHLAVWFVEAFTKRWTPWALETVETSDLAEEGKIVWAMDDVLRLAARQRRLPTMRHDINLRLDYFDMQRRAQGAVDRGLPEPPVTYGRARYLLATVAPLTRDELRAFIVEQGGFLYDEDIYEGAFAGTEDQFPTLAVEWKTEQRFAELRRWDPSIGVRRGARTIRRNHTAMARIVDVMGARPHDFVELHLLDGPTAQPAAAAFVEAFARRWTPTVLETGFNPNVAEEGKLVWRMDEVLPLIHAQHRLPTLRPGIESWRELFLT